MTQQLWAHLSAALDGSAVRSAVMGRRGAAAEQQAEPDVGMFPGASEPVGGAGTWANRTKERAGMSIPFYKPTPSLSGQ